MVRKKGTEVKAIVHTKYRSPEVLQLQEVAKPNNMLQPTLLRYAPQRG
jgi:hypothetical protein